MADLNEDQLWAGRIVRLLVYLLIALAVAYAIVNYWAPPFDLRQR